MGDGGVLPPSNPATHKPNSNPRFSQAYAASLEYQYLIDNNTILLAVTASAYKLVLRMFFPLLGMPMRRLKNLCSLRLR
jgi:hypothetical protein